MDSVKLLFFTFFIITISVSSAGHAQQRNVSKVQDIGYGPDQQQTLDIYRPEVQQQNIAAVILIHGGGWGGGDKADYANTARLAAASGLVAVTINYRLTNVSRSVRWPTQLEDVQAGVRWVREHAVQLGINENRICAMGASAGGHLAVFLAVLRRSNGANIACAVDEFGPVDLTTFFQEAPVNLFGTGDAAAQREKLKAASPLNFVTEETAPILILQGSGDTSVRPEQSQKLERALLNAGVWVRLITFTGGHGFKGLSAHQYNSLRETEFRFIATGTIP